MNFWRFIKPDKGVLGLSLLLFLLSLLVSEFLQGYPGNVNCNYCNSQCGGCGMQGFGVPFIWYNVITTCGEGAYPYHLSGGRAPPMCAAAQLVTQFEPVNFMLNIIIFYVAALLLVRGYDYFFKNKKKK